MLSPVWGYQKQYRFDVLALTRPYRHCPIRLGATCLLFPKADVQIQLKPLNLEAAFGQERTLPFSIFRLKACTRLVMSRRAPE